MTFSVAYTASGTGLQSFAFPVSGSIQAVFLANQASAAFVSLTGVVAPTSGVTGGDRSLIASFVATGVGITGLDFTIDQGQTVFIDVKTAGTFLFIVKG